MAKAATSKPKPFLATVTPVEISKGDTVSGVRFTKMAGPTVARKGVKAMTRTVMAFGRANAVVARSLKAGKPIDVICRWDGGIVRIVCRPEKKRSEEYPSELQSPQRMSYIVLCMKQKYLKEYYLHITYHYS